MMAEPKTYDTLAIIPARGGSRSVPKKNIAPVAGKPLIAWTIHAAQHSQCVSRMIISTDDEQIADTARQYGAQVPFLRPAELARDDTPGIDPIVHAVQWLEQHEHYQPDYVLVLQPTSPLRTPQDIDSAVHLAVERQADSVVSITSTRHHPYWMKQMSEEGLLHDFLPRTQSYTRRQDLPSAYALNGAIYLVRREVLLAQRTFYTDRSYGYMMPPERSHDVDTPWDLFLVDLVLQYRQAHEID
jgi:CMP-N-acetylneuraminic acid synthetase